MILKHLTTILLFFACTGLSSQSRDASFQQNFVGGQIGGQLNIGAFYERSFLTKKNLLLNGQLGLGLNISGEAKYDLSATYSIQPGCTVLAGPRPFFFEIGPFANLNKSGKHTFANLNAWIGLRFITQKGFFIGLGYTPVVYKTFTDQSNYGDTWLALKLGATF